MSTEHVMGYMGKATSAGRELILRGIAPKPIVLVTGSGANDAWLGTDDNELAEIIVVADKDNSGAVQVSLHAVVGAANYLALGAKDSIKLEGIKYSEVHLNFVVDGDKASILRAEADGPLSAADTV